MSEITKEDLDLINIVIKENEDLANDELKVAEYIGVLLNFYREQESFDYKRWDNLFNKFYEILEDNKFPYADKLFEVGLTLTLSLHLNRDDLVADAIFYEAKSFNHVGWEKKCAESGERRRNIKVLDLKGKKGN